MRIAASAAAFGAAAATTALWLYYRQHKSSAAATPIHKPHDVGGAPELLQAPIPAHQPNTAWEMECHALFACLAKAGFFSTDEHRRAVEQLPKAYYDCWGYYEKWSAAMAATLRERGTLAHGELEKEMFGDDPAPTAERPARFKAGDAVVVRYEEKWRSRWRAPHLRTPGYIFGARGVIERSCGRFADPSASAYHEPNPPKHHLYRVRFSQTELWPEVEVLGEHDTVDVEIYEPWLLKPDEAPPPLAPALRLSYAHSVTNAVSASSSHAHTHSHDGGKPETHVHLSRPEVEAAAVEVERPPSPGSRVHEALLRITLRRGLVTRDALRKTIEAMELAGSRPEGARLIARAWVDPAFTLRLLADGNAAAAELGINASNPNAPTKLHVVQNDDQTHNLVVCTLCSCYPLVLLGPSPTWYKSRSYRARGVRAPRALLQQEFGLELSSRRTLRVHDSTADLRYLVLPKRPPQTEGFSEDQLRDLVTRDGMIGVAEL